MSFASTRGRCRTAVLATLAALVLCLLLPCSVSAQRGSYREGRPDRYEGAPRPGVITPERLERWRSKTPEEREQIRERYHRWKELPPERRERILERYLHEPPPAGPRGGAPGYSPPTDRPSGPPGAPPGYSPRPNPRFPDRGPKPPRE